MMRNLIDILVETEIDPVEAMLSEWRGMTWENPLNPRNRVYENSAVVEMRPGGPQGQRDTVYLSDIRSLVRGGGTKTLEKIIELAEKYKISISLYSKAYEEERNGSIDQKSLDRWYIAHGFKPDNGAGPGWFLKKPQGFLKLGNSMRTIDMEKPTDGGNPVIRLRGFDRKH
jgi:hypothetical protein